MTLEEYNEKYHDVDPFALGKNIFTLEHIDDYDTIPIPRYSKKKRKLSDEQREQKRKNIKQHMKLHKENY